MPPIPQLTNRHRQKAAVIKAVYTMISTWPASKCMPMAKAPMSAHGAEAGRPPSAGVCRMTRSHMARMSGSQAAAAMIMGNTTDTIMKPLNW